MIETTQDASALWKRICEGYELLDTMRKDAAVPISAFADDLHRFDAGDGWRFFKGSDGRARSMDDFLEHRGLNLRKLKPIREEGFVRVLIEQPDLPGPIVRVLIVRDAAGAISEADTKRVAEIALKIADAAGEPLSRSHVKTALSVHRRQQMNAVEQDPDGRYDREEVLIPPDRYSAWDQRPAFDQAARKIREAASEVKALREGPAGGPLKDDVGKTLMKLAKAIEDARPHTVCPYCENADSPGPCCEGVGFVTETVYSKVHATQRKRRERAGLFNQGAEL